MPTSWDLTGSLLALATENAPCLGQPVNSLTRKIASSIPGYERSAGISGVRSDRFGSVAGFRNFDALIQGHFEIWRERNQNHISAADL